MARRRYGNMNGERWLGNTHKNEVHDLDSEKVSCWVEETIGAGHDQPFATHAEARAAGFDNCASCIGGSSR